MSGSPKIVLTGGPGGGKSTLMEELRTEDPAAQRWALVPEAATILIRAGHLPGTREFQLAVVRLQFCLEDSIASLTLPTQTIVCDRSAVDSLAYWLELGGTEPEFLEAIETTRADLYARYDAALHLQTAAIGADEHYEQVAAGGARMEDSDEAARIDSRCAQVWKVHPGYRHIPNGPGGWPAKSAEARKHLETLASTA